MSWDNYCNTYNFRLEWRLYLPFLQLLPFYISEEGVMFDGLLTSVILENNKIRI